MAKTILLLDDDPYFRRQVAPALRERGLEVLEAPKLLAAKRFLLAGTPDAAVVDGLLPDGSGIDFIADLRAAGHRLPVVFVSAFFRDLASYKRLTQDLSVARVMYKPVVPERLVELLVELAGAEREPSPAPVNEDAAALAEVDVIFVSDDDADEASPEPPPATPESLDELAEAYRKMLPEVVRRLARAAWRARRMPDDTERLAELRREAHEVRGTAGSFGAREVGRLAGVIEDAIVGAPDEALEGAALWDSIVETVASMRTEVGLSADSAPPPPLLELDGIDEPPTASRLSGPRVLLVDDDPTFLEHLEETARARLFEVVTATDVEGALAAVDTGAPDVALVASPFGSPDRSRELIESLPIPAGVVALDDELEHRLTATRAGAHLFLAQPIDADAFERAVRELAAVRAAPARVTLLSEEPAALARAREALGATAELSIVDDAARLLPRLDALAPDAILVDGSLRGIDAKDLCRTLRASERFADAVLLIVGADPGGVIGAGATDALDPARTDEWAAVVAHRVAQHRRALRRGDRDRLTDLPTRAVVLSQMIARLNEAQRHKQPFSVCVLEVDDCPGVVRQQGRVGLERVLAGLAGLLRSRMRLEDLRGRWNDQCFVLGLAGVGASGIAPALRRMQDEFARLQFASPQEGTFHATFSAGVASYPDSGASVDDLLGAAELRLRTTKASGVGAG